jgi:NADH:ubiquinone oxidoreductase subunit E
MKTPEEKKVYMLLKSVIFNYHGLDEAERTDLDNTAQRLEAQAEYKWALDFIAKDYITAFERAREYLNEIIADYPKETRIELINMVWQANNLKGYVTEMEATAMLKLAKDWNVQKELVELVLK